MTETTDALWYKSAVVYQLHVRAFYDSDGDGIGDFRGLTRKLDYLRQLGVTAIWLLPFYPSPLKDDGYDIADYETVHASYGSLEDFRIFLREAHRHGLEVITELVLNHTSDQHPWFQRARRAAPGSPERDFYVWSESSEKYQQARIIFQDFETSNWSWDPKARAYYWHRFFHHQPDLNYDNPAVREAVFAVVDHWLGMGVDGLRLDGVPYLYEREGTTCENLPETHAFLKRLRKHVDAKFHGRMLLAEANQWPEDAAAYFGDGDECHTAFHFPVMPRMYMALQMEDRFPIVDILDQTPAIPDSCQWMLFLRNHDELTLEMVTEEERDFMYRFYARDPRARINLGIRRRLATLMENDRRKIQLLNGLLLALPGTPIIYYGDEIGMGDNIYLGDRNGVRTPMQWSADRNAGFSYANPQQLYLPPIIDYEFHYETVNVETQSRNPNSLLSWMTRTVRLRQNLGPLTYGSLEFLHPENTKVLAFIRSAGGERVLVVANLSRYAQFVELDLSAYNGYAPVELSGQIRFPLIGELPYLLTLTPYAFFWFALHAPEVREEGLGVEPALTSLKTTERWENVVEEPWRQQLEAVLPTFLSKRSWHRHPREAIRSATIADVVPIVADDRNCNAHRRGGFQSASAEDRSTAQAAALALVAVEYADAPREVYAVPLAFSSESQAAWADSEGSEVAIARLEIEHEGLHQTGILYDGYGAAEFAETLRGAMAAGRLLEGRGGSLLARPLPVHRRGEEELPEPYDVGPKAEEQSNSFVAWSDGYVLKLFRRVEEGPHPELEIGAYLSETGGISHATQIAGVLEYQAAGQHPALLGLLQVAVPHERTAWHYTLDALGSYLWWLSPEQQDAPPPSQTLPEKSLVELAAGETPDLARKLLPTYLPSIELLGRRTAELHLALGAETEDPAFMPESLLPFHLRSVYQSFRNLLGRASRRLERMIPELEPAAREAALAIQNRRNDLLERVGRVLQERITGTRIRCHGEYRLEEILCAGDDFVIVDFEGDPSRPLSERRFKTPALRDVAGILWSFHRAGQTALGENLSARAVDEEELLRLEAWIHFWWTWTSAEFLRSYLAVAGDAATVPEGRQAAQSLLDLYLAERAAIELERDLEHRIDKVPLALRSLVQLIGAASTAVE